MKNQGANEIEMLKPGMIVAGVVTGVKPYGAFVKLDNGVNGLIHIEDISIARVKTPLERLNIGQNVNIMVKSIDNSGRILLSYKEMLGSWEENAKGLKKGMIIEGIAREKEKYNNGIFIEIKPNLVGLADYKENIEYGQIVNVYVKNIIPEKKKIKLKIL